MEELGSSNALQNLDMARTNRDKKGDVDLEDDSNHGLDIWNGMDTGINPRGGRKSEEVALVRCWGSDTVVEETRSDVELAMRIGNNTIGLPTVTEECRAMMDLGSHKVGSKAAISGTRQSMDDQLLTPGYVRSLGRSSLSRLGIQIEVVLDQTKEICQGHGLEEIQKSQNGSKDQISAIEEVGAAVGHVESSPSNQYSQNGPKDQISNNKEGGVQLGQLEAAQVYLKLRSFDLHKTKRGRRRLVLQLNMATYTPKRVPLVYFEDMGIEGPRRHILIEAQANLEIGEMLGVNYNGKEDEVLH
ncbi:hypothetical protein CsSME_00008248 [Camellia sinensis var. sinensis]